MSFSYVGSPYIDYNSPDWLRVTEHLAEDREHSLKYILNKDVTIDETNFHRGRIAQIDAILEWASNASR